MSIYSDRLTFFERCIIEILSDSGEWLTRKELTVQSSQKTNFYSVRPASVSKRLKKLCRKVRFGITIRRRGREYIYRIRQVNLNQLEKGGFIFRGFNGYDFV